VKLQSHRAKEELLGLQVLSIVLCVSSWDFFLGLGALVRFYIILMIILFEGNKIFVYCL
jgi:hypothetical protein